MYELFTIKNKIHGRDTENGLRKAWWNCYKANTILIKLTSWQHKQLIEGFCRGLNYFKELIILTPNDAGQSKSIFLKNIYTFITSLIKVDFLYQPKVKGCSWYHNTTICQPDAVTIYWNPFVFMLWLCVQSLLYKQSL